ncbi:tRNA (guanosine(46)-N7)-methyltransferase TrmB [Helicobacter cholecystus]|uniref:tRNA (guanosine(46)-N7)-methyltransferase TrmB n=1 Tax=Helicobacter cholecystus TaxID=45498 RepID=UPI002738FD4D|nr:tRNA (guanosine(46)-N7)-methyltransferase TrmB [Helicobacter cholecystus]
MPHALASQVYLPSFPFENEGYEFKYLVEKLNDPSHSLIFTRFGKYEFFIQKRFRHKHNDYILKCEKLSHSIPTGIYKGAIRALCAFFKEYITHHNLNNDSLRQTLQSPYQKSIWDFLNFSTPFELEIGFGSGRHILQKAKTNPQTLFVGIEIHTPSIEQVLRQIEILGLNNLYIVNFDARIFLELIASNVVGAIYVHFPVPWGKKPHRRVWSDRFLQESMRVLKKGGSLELRSDDEDYFNYALGISLNHSLLDLRVRKNFNHRVVSKYEQRWRKQEKNIYDLFVYALSDSEPRQEIERFCFPEVQKLKRSFDTIPLKVIQKDFFLHIDSIFQHSNRCVLKLSFGDFNQPQSKFVVIDDDGARYISADPLPTLASYQAHQELLRQIRRDN